tara:strand:+ start:427 stop:711 length:285 start_codon:yes stop_codon:yes gene_type:complete
MKYQFQGKQYPTIQAMVLAVNPIINAWSDEMIEQFYVNNVLPFDKRSITDIMRDEYRCDACGWSAPSHEDLTYSVEQMGQESRGYPQCQNCGMV